MKFRLNQHEYLLPPRPIFHRKYEKNRFHIILRTKIYENLILLVYFKFCIEKMISIFTIFASFFFKKVFSYFFCDKIQVFTGFQTMSNKL